MFSSLKGFYFVGFVGGVFVGGVGSYVGWVA